MIDFTLNQKHSKKLNDVPVTVSQFLWSTRTQSYPERSRETPISEWSPERAHDAPTRNDWNDRNRRHEYYDEREKKKPQKEPNNPATYITKTSATWTTGPPTVDSRHSSRPVAESLLMSQTRLLKTCRDCGFLACGLVESCRLGCWSPPQFLLMRWFFQSRTQHLQAMMCLFLVLLLIDVIDNVVCFPPPFFEDCGPILP